MPLSNVFPLERPVKATVGCDGAVVSTFTVWVTVAVFPTRSVPVSVKR